MKQRGFYYDKARGRKSPLTNERQEMLEAIGFAWVAPHVCKTKAKLHLREHIMAAEASKSRVSQDETIAVTDLPVEEHQRDHRQQMQMQPHSVLNPTHPQQLPQQFQPQQQVPQYANQAPMAQNQNQLQDLGEQLMQSLTASQNVAPVAHTTPFSSPSNTLYPQGFSGPTLHPTADPMQPHMQQLQHLQTQIIGQSPDQIQHYQDAMLQQYVPPNYQFIMPNQQQSQFQTQQPLQHQHQLQTQLPPPQQQQHHQQQQHPEETSHSSHNYFHPQM